MASLPSQCTLRHSPCPCREGESKAETEIAGLIRTTAGTWGAVQQDAGALAETRSEEVRVPQWQLHRVQDGRFDIRQPANVLPPAGVLTMR